jgi:integrase
MPTARLTKSSIHTLEGPRRGNQVLHQDREQDGLAVRVTANGARSFVVDRNTSRGRIRITLGPAGTDTLTVPQAREKARIAIGLIGQGYTREQIEERLARAEDRVPPGAMTLDQVLDRYMKRRKHRLSERTRSDYRQLMDTHLADWKDRPIELLDDEAVVAKFHSIKSPSRANYTMRLLRALFRSAMKVKDDEGRPIINENPVAALTDEGLWHETPPRRDVIKLHEFPAWWKGVNALAEEGNTEATREANGRFSEGTTSPNGRPDVVADYLRFLLLTGLRRNEAAHLTWADVDMKGRTVSIAQTKNRQPHTLPTSDYLLDLLQRRLEAKTSEYVFPGRKGPLAEPKKQIEKVVAASGVAFSSHTLRRTFATIAESLDIPYFALKRLLNHKTQDVTGQHYTVITVERLREPMQKITDFILKAAGMRESAPVIGAKKPRGKRAA